MMNAEQALASLRQGNRRFVTGQRIYPNQDAQRIQEIASGQNPYATILCCSDSRVAPEHIFDTGLGELFVIRVAGNVVGPIPLGSLEFGVSQCNTPLLIVLGHTNCGAIQAAVQGTDVQSHIVNLVDEVNPAVDMARKENANSDESDLIDRAVRGNVLQSIENLVTHSPIIHDSLKNGSLTIAGSVYHLDSGKVEWLDLDT